jgi:hypothetical protein
MRRDIENQRMMSRDIAAAEAEIDRQIHRLTIQRAMLRRACSDVGGQIIEDALLGLYGPDLQRPGHLEPITECERNARLRRR